MTRKRKAGEPLLRGDESCVVDRDPTGCRIRAHRCPPSRLWRRQADGNSFACRQGSSWRGQLGDEIARPVRDPESRRPGSARRQRNVDGHSPDGSSTRGAIFKSVPVDEDVAGVDLYRSLKAWSRQRRRLGPPEARAGRQGDGHQHDRDCRESPGARIGDRGGAPDRERRGADRGPPASSSETCRPAAGPTRAS